MKEFTTEELDLLRQWYNCILDIHPKYLNPEDKKLFKKIIKSLYIKKGE